MTHKSQLEKPKYRNWVRAGLGLLYVKEGLEPFCDDIVQQQHTDIINKVQQTQSLATVTCGQCNLRTLKPNHVRDQHRQCPLRQVNCNCQYPGGKNPCPNNVCGAIYDEIINLHASTPPAPFWKNTDAQHWCTDPWSIARCFINAPGYADKLSVSDTDCSGILHVLINNRGLHSHIQCPITGTDIFSEVRKYRNSIYHSSSMELEDSDVTGILDNMIAVLQDGKELNNRAEAQAAVQKLTQLKKEDFIITTRSEAQVFEAVVNALTEKVKEITDKIQAAVELKNDIETKKNDALDEIQTRSSSSIAEMNESVAKRRKIDKTITEDLQKVSDKTEHISKRVDKLEADMSEMNEKIKQIKKELSNLRIELEKNNEKKLSRQDKLDYIKKKECFQTRLIELYEETVVRVPAVPLQPRGNRKDIGTVYVQPRLEMETCQPDQSSKPTNDQISMHEIFSSNDKRVSLIYVLGEAGTGKSAFCIYLVRQWCNAHTSHAHVSTTDNESDAELVKKLKTFEFLFYITLRHNIGCDDIRSMLHQQYADPILDRILENESSKCLILLDGLDEWTQNKEASQFQTKGLPTRDASKEYTVLTTSRPWKFGTLGVKDTEVHRKVTLEGLNWPSLQDMGTKFVDMLNRMFQKNKQYDDFTEKLYQSKVSEIGRIPIILQQLICLWFDDKLHGTSISATYSSMLELFFDWTELKSLEGDNLSRVKDSAQNAEVQLPEYLNSSDTCNNFKYIISSLSRLAFETLFSVIKENSLSFTSSTFQHLKIPIDVKDCFLITGLLTEERRVTLNASSREKSSFSFSHKTIQEYLAAVYIAIEFEALTEVRFQDKCKECVGKYFAACKTVDDILKHSKVFIMLCGLKPQLITNISEYINDIVINDEKQHIDFRDALQTTTDYFYISMTGGHPRRKYISYLTGIQSCISRCVEEVVTTGKELQQCICLAYIFLEDNYGISGVCEQAIIPQRVLTLHTDSEKLYKLLPEMTNLTSLAITETPLSGEDCRALNEFLTQSTQLKNIVVSVDCREHEAHRLDLSKHDKIDCIMYGVCGFSVRNLILERNIVCVDWVTGSRTEIVVSCTEYKVRGIHLHKHFFECQYVNDTETKTYSFLILLPLVMSFSTLIVGGSTLVDPVFSNAPDMKSLEKIKLERTIMSMTTWCKFIDSLPALPNAVDVDTFKLKIKNDGDDSMSSNRVDNSKVHDENDDSLHDETRNDCIVDEVSDDSTDDVESYVESDDSTDYEEEYNYRNAKEYVRQKKELFRSNFFDEDDCLTFRSIKYKE